jgi:hypothetical protein
MTVFCSNLLLAYFHYTAAGHISLTLNWHKKSIMDMVDNNPMVISLIRKLKDYTGAFSK